eukprot:11196610-Lingulodinium_polyedra.AAC.1
MQPTTACSGHYGRRIRMEAIWKSCGKLWQAFETSSALWMSTCHSGSLNTWSLCPPGSFQGLRWPRPFGWLRASLE